MPGDQYPADFGGYVLGALPYAGLEALRIAAWCAAAVALAAAGVWLLGRARRLARPPLPRRERDLPALSRAIGNVERRTRPMRIGDMVISREGERLLQARAAALTPDALTEAIPWCPWCDDLSPAPEPGDCDKPCGKQ